MLFSLPSHALCTVRYSSKSPKTKVVLDFSEQTLGCCHLMSLDRCPEMLEVFFFFFLFERSFGAIFQIEITGLLRTIV